MPQAWLPALKKQAKKEVDWNSDEHQQPAPPDPKEVVGQISSVVQHLPQITAAAFDADMAAEPLEERAACRAS